MEAFRLLRQQSIDSLASLQHDTFPHAAIGLWERVAIQVIALVGEAGFDSLYARSVFLAVSSFPWLTESTEPVVYGHRFDRLRSDLEEQPPELALEANRHLLVIFTDTLASLIGEPLTECVWKAAWGNFALCGENWGGSDG